MSLIKYKNFEIEYKEDKFNLNHVLFALGYEPFKESIFVDKEDLINIYLDSKYKVDKEFIDFIKLKFLSNKLNITEFIKFNKLNISNNDVLNEIWFSLKNKKDILITPVILNFIYNIKNENVSENNIRILKKDFINFLNEHKITFKQIDYKNIRTHNYLYIPYKKYIILSLKNFKKITTIDSLVRDEYLKMEKIFSLYNKYEKEYEKQKIKINIDNNIIKKNNLIYIFTSKSFASKNKFKIGGINNIEYLKKKLKSNTWYFTFISQVNDYKKFENKFWSVLKNFKDKKHKKTIIMYYLDLLDIFEFIKDNYEEDTDFFNTRIKKILNNKIENTNFIPEPYNIKIVNYIYIKNGKPQTPYLISGSEREIKEILTVF